MDKQRNPSRVSLVTAFIDQVKHNSELRLLLFLFVHFDLHLFFIFTCNLCAVLQIVCNYILTKHQFDEQYRLISMNDQWYIKKLHGNFRCEPCFVFLLV